MGIPQKSLKVHLVLRQRTLKSPSEEKERERVKGDVFSLLETELKDHVLKQVPWMYDEPVKMLPDDEKQAGSLLRRCKVFLKHESPV